MDSFDFMCKEKEQPRQHTVGHEALAKARRHQASRYTWDKKGLLHGTTQISETFSLQHDNKARLPPLAINTFTNVLLILPFASIGHGLGEKVLDMSTRTVCIYY